MAEAATHCGRCEAPLHLIVRCDGKKSLSCGTCGDDGLAGCSQSYSHDELVSPDQGEGGHKNAFNVNNPTSTGHHHGTQITTKARKEASQLIEHLCHEFKIVAPDLKGAMEALLTVTKFSPLKAGVCGVFVAITRQSYDRGELSDHITHQQVSSYAEVDLPRVNSAISYIENLLSPKQKESARKGAVFGADDIPLPKFKVPDPIIPGDATNRVKTLAKRIIETFLKITSQSLEPNCLGIAAASLGYQSCFFYQKSHLENIPDEDLPFPEMWTLKEFFDRVGAKGILGKINKSARVIEKDLNLTDKMAWLPRSGNESFKRFLARKFVKFQILVPN